MLLVVEAQGGGAWPPGAITSMVLVSLWPSHGLQKVFLGPHLEDTSDCLDLQVSSCSSWD